VNQHEYNQLREQIEHDYREKLRALELVWSLSQAVLTRNRRGRTEVAADPNAGNALLAAARTAIAQLPYFSIAEVEREIQKSHPELIAKRSSLNALMRSLMADGEVVLVEGRRGKPDAVYRRAESDKIKAFKARAQTIIQNYPDLLNPAKASS